MRAATWRARRLLVSLGAAALVLLAAAQLAPPASPTDPVAVTTRTVEAGTELTVAHLTVVDVPRGVVPADVLGTVEDAVGRVTAVDLPARLPVVASLLVGDRFHLPVPPGAVAVPVRLADPDVTALIRPGDRLDLVVPDDGHHEVGGSRPRSVLVARDALVLEVPAPTGDAGSGLLPGGGADGATVVVVAVRVEEGRALAAVGGRSPLGAVLVG